MALKNADDLGQACWKILKNAKKSSQKLFGIKISIESHPLLEDIALSCLCMRTHNKYKISKQFFNLNTKNINFQIHENKN